MIKKIDLFVVIHNGGMGIISAAIFWIIKVLLQSRRSMINKPYKILKMIRLDF